MLRDRVPLTVDLALKWCKAKQRWIDHTYDSFINIYKDKKERKNSTRIILGISKHEHQMNFHKSIDWDQLTKDEKDYWNIVERWVNWFKQIYSYISNDYDTSLVIGKDINTFKSEIISKYLTSLDEITQQRLVEFLIKNLQNGNY